MGERMVSIYGLMDPRDDSCFYVGRAYTDRLQRRLLEHVAETRRELKDDTYDKPTTRKRRIIASLLEAGLYPEIESLEEIPEEGWGEAEQAKMDEYREFCDLTNIAPGGQGPSNWNEVFVQAWEGNPERKRNLSERNRTNWKDPEFRVWVSSLIHEHHSQPEYREWMAGVQKESWIDNDEAKRKISEAQLENWKNPEYREAVTRSNIETWSDPELLETHAERTRELWQDPEYREKVVAAISDPEVQARRRESMQETWDEEKREQQAEVMRAIWEDPEQRAKREAINRESGPQISQSLQEYYAEHPEARENLSQKATERMADPARREHLSGAVKDLWDDPEYRERQLRARNAGKLRSDVEKAAEALGVKPITVYKYCNQGRLGRKVGGSWVITDEEIEEFGRKG